MNDIKKFTRFAQALVFSSLFGLIVLVSAVQAASEDETEFLKAAFSARTEVIQQMLEKGININHQNEMWAAFHTSGHDGILSIFTGFHNQIPFGIISSSRIKPRAES